MNNLRTQTRRMSLIEAVVNTAFGFTIQVAAQYGLFVFFGVPITRAQFWLFTIAMTFLSVGRGFVIRRLFNSEVWKRFKRGKPDTTMQGVQPPTHFNCRCTPAVTEEQLKKAYSNVFAIDERRK